MDRDSESTIEINSLLMNQMNIIHQSQIDVHRLTSCIVGLWDSLDAHVGPRLYAIATHPFFERITLAAAGLRPKMSSGTRGTIVELILFESQLHKVGKWTFP
jgi:hypothetical protein